MQGAARALHVTPSSLSRAIRLVEESLGRRLFDRVGRNVRLNQDGRALLAAVRDGMRLMDDGIAGITDTVFAGELRVVCEGDQPIAFAWGAAARLRAAHEALHTTVSTAGPWPSVVARLLRGDIDVALVSSVSDHPKLRVEHLGDVSYGIYCGPTHPLYRRRDATTKVICAHPFVGPTRDEHDGSADRWPAGVPREVVLRLPALAPAIAVCVSGALLAVLPDVAAQGHDLRRLRSDILEPAPLHAVRRQRAGTSAGPDRAEAFVTELRAELVAGVGMRPRRSRPEPAPVTAPRGRPRKRAGR